MGNLHELCAWVSCETKCAQQTIMCNMTIKDGSIAEKSNLKPVSYMQGAKATNHNLLEKRTGKNFKICNGEIGQLSWSGYSLIPQALQSIQVSLSTIRLCEDVVPHLYSSEVIIIKQNIFCLLENLFVINSHAFFFSMEKRLQRFHLFVPN